ncbi:MAG TPA: HAMP domain-containing sensor histidine kinase [Polyangiaceae bacterium]|nr:HAMP domain-containing sensor histidine kinase [Polyangiaceae bacterium]
MYRTISPPGLRSSMLALFALLIVVAVGAGASLLATTTAMSHHTAEVGVADARMRSSLRTKSALLWFARASDDAASDPTPEALAAQSAARAELLADAQETRRLATPSRTAQLDNLVQRAAHYVELRDQLQQEGLTIAEVLRRATPALEAVFADIQNLVDADDAWARSVQASARRLDAVAGVVTVAASVLLLGGFAVAFVASERLLQRPVLALDDVMLRFGRGETDARAELSGAREVREIAATFNDVADRLARQEQERVEFLGGVAHDLRNPLMPLRLALDRFERGHQPPSAEMSARLIAVVRKQLGRLDAMVGDMVDAARVQAGRLELQPRDIDVRAVVDGVVALYRPVSQEHQIEVDAPAEALVAHADPLRIEQVLVNLVSNAIKYSPGGGRVTLHIARSDGEIGIEVSDEGIGVPEPERERIFEPFHRTGRSREVAPGVGLGLSVSRRIAQAHGGNLELERAERGTTFRLTIPAATRNEPE